mmetsp:Transcript_4867/g.17642  ORF Transcript_4867/g.17642 Transcript_4867/m.17642 type:complete len:282 (+) Transcript_4867:139-984(+)
MATAAKEIASNRCFNGAQKRFEHDSETLGCKMTFGVYLPDTPADKVPVLYYLSGLTCTDENVVIKAGAQKYASELGIAFVSPDTSPRGLNIDGEDESYDFGTGAGFYINATTEKWAKYRMQEYVMQELPGVLAATLPQLDLSRQSITGHSMGGHGALSLSLKHPGHFKSTSAFAPICNPTVVPWGIKAFTGYLGEDQESWKAHDTCCLAEAYSGPPFPVLVDQGMADNFLENQLKIEHLEAKAKTLGDDVTIRKQAGYDHSYFFIATFMEDHMRFHASHLK